MPEVPKNISHNCQLTKQLFRSKPNVVNLKFNLDYDKNKNKNILVSEFRNSNMRFPFKIVAVLLFSREKEIYKLSSNFLNT